MQVLRVAAVASARTRTFSPSAHWQARRSSRRATPAARTTPPLWPTTLWAAPTHVSKFSVGTDGNMSNRSFATAPAPKHSRSQNCSARRTAPCRWSPTTRWSCWAAWWPARPTSRACWSRWGACLGWGCGVVPCGARSWMRAWLRAVPHHVRAVSLAFAMFVTSLISTAPSTIVVGKVIDSTCLLWNSVCGRRGACLVYDPGLFRVRYAYAPVLILCRNLCLQF